MSSEAVAGISCRTYYNTATHASPTLVEITRAGDITVTLGKTEADVSARGVTWELKCGIAKTLEMSMSYLYTVGTDTVWTALQDSFLNGTAIEIYALDGNSTTSNNKGIRGYYEVFDFPYDQTLTDAMRYNIGLKLTRFVEAGAIIAPDYYVVP